MNSMEQVRFPVTGARPQVGQVKQSPPPFCTELVGPVRNAIVRARQCLITRQRSDGAWRGRQMGAVSLLSQLIFMLAYLERNESELADECATTIRYEQRPDGGWSTTPDGATDLRASVQAYFALKLAGQDPTDARMRQARERIRSLGGADAADAETRYFLALFGQMSYDACDSMPPEMFLFGRQKSLLEATKAILWSHRPVCPIEIRRGVRELFVEQPIKWSAHRLVTRRLPKMRGLRARTPLRRRAMHRIEQQVLERSQPTQLIDLTCQKRIFQVIALRTLGYGACSAEIGRCEKALHELVEVDETTGCAYPRFSTSPVADSAIVLRSLVESGMSPLHPAIQEGRDFVSSIAQVSASLSPAEICNIVASLRNYDPQRSNFVFSLPPDLDVCWDWNDSNFSDEFNPDNSDSGNQSKIDSLIARLTTLRNSSEPHMTGAVIESLAQTGNADAQAAIDRGTRFVESQQYADGSWSDSDGTYQILSTSSAIRGLLAAGSSADLDCIAAAVNWLSVEQLPNGSWNNSPTETAWAVLGLVAAGKVNEPAARRGAEYLLAEQNEEGGWTERRLVFCDRGSNQWFGNDLQSTAWSLMALSRFAVAAASAAHSPADGQVSLRLVSAL